MRRSSVRWQTSDAALVRGCSESVKLVANNGDNKLKCPTCQAAETAEFLDQREKENVMTSLSDSVVLITGSAGNLGVAVARRFLKAEARLVLLDRSPDRLARLYPDLVDDPRHHLAGSVDLIDASAVEKTIAGTVEKFGRIDTLINTAGGYRAGTSVADTPLEDWDFLFNLNARALFTICRAVIPQMRAQRSGRMVNVGSRAGLHGDPNAALYSASKAVVIRLTESLSAELKEDGINVNCILPGLIDTPPNRKAIPGADFSRWVTPESLAEVILFLVSDAARDISGAAIPVYGKS
jgi:NAD(P)-dependent dehydrogenase (short-subunit alcohol dehydrogenase family)